MPQIQALDDDEQETVRQALERFAAMEGETDEGEDSPTFEEKVCDGDVEVYAFPLSSDEPGQPIDTLRVAVTVDPDADWFEDLTAYSRGNLQNGGPIYQSLADELESITADAAGARERDVAFTARKGSHHFTAEVAL